MGDRSDLCGGWICGKSAGSPAGIGLGSVSGDATSAGNITINGVGWKVLNVYGGGQLSGSSYASADGPAIGSMNSLDPSHPATITIKGELTLRLMKASTSSSNRKDCVPLLMNRTNSSSNPAKLVVEGAQIYAISCNQSAILADDVEIKRGSMIFYTQLELCIPSPTDCYSSIPENKAINAQKITITGGNVFTKNDNGTDSTIPSMSSRPLDANGDPVYLKHLIAGNSKNRSNKAIYYLGSDSTVIENTNYVSKGINPVQMIFGNCNSTEDCATHFYYYVPSKYVNMHFWAEDNQAQHFSLLFRWPTVDEPTAANTNSTSYYFVSQPNMTVVNGAMGIGSTTYNTSYNASTNARVVQSGATTTVNIRPSVGYTLKGFEINGSKTPANNNALFSDTATAVSNCRTTLAASAQGTCSITTKAITENVGVIPVFEEKAKVKITFNNNGGSTAAPAAVDVLPGINTTLPNYTGTKTGWTFKGWASTGKDENNTNTHTCLNSTNLKAANSSFNTLADVTLFACWKDETGPNPVTAPTISVPTSTTKSARISVALTTDPGPVTPQTSLQYRVEIGTTACSGSPSSPLMAWTTKSAAFTVDYTGFTAGTAFSVSVCAKDLAGNFSAIRTTSFTVYSITYNVNTGSGTAPATQYAISGTSVTLDSAYVGTKAGWTLQDKWTTATAAPSNSATSCAATSYDKGGSASITANLALYACWLDKTAPGTISSFTPSTIASTDATIAYSAASDDNNVTPQASLLYKVVRANNSSGATNNCVDNIADTILDWTTNKISDISWPTTAQIAGTNYITVCVKDLAGNVNQSTHEVVNQMTLTYDANGASGGTLPSSVDYAPNALVTVSAAYSSGDTTTGRVGYTFSGWSTSNAVSPTATACPGTTYQPGDTLNITANTTLYACWLDKTTPNNPPTSGFSTNTTDITQAPITITYPATTDVGSVTADANLQYRLVTWTNSSTTAITNCQSGTDVAVISSWNTFGSVTYDANNGLKKGNNYITVCSRDQAGNRSSGTLYTLFIPYQLETARYLTRCGNNSLDTGTFDETCTSIASGSSSNNWRVDDANGTQKVRFSIEVTDPNAPSTLPTFGGSVSLQYTLPYGTPPASTCNSSTRVCSQAVSTPTWTQKSGTKIFYTDIVLTQSIYAQNSQISFEYSGSSDLNYAPATNTGYVSNITLAKIPSKTFLYTYNMKKKPGADIINKTTSDTGFVAAIVVPTTCDIEHSAFTNGGLEFPGPIPLDDYLVDGIYTFTTCTFSDNGNGGGTRNPRQSAHSSAGIKYFVPTGVINANVTIPPQTLGGTSTTMALKCNVGGGISNISGLFIAQSLPGYQMCLAGTNRGGITYGMVKPSGTWTISNITYNDDETGHIDGNIGTSGESSGSFTIDKSVPTVAVNTSLVANLTPNSPSGVSGEYTNAFIYVTLRTGLYTVDPPAASLCVKNDATDADGDLIDLTDASNPKCVSGTLPVSNASAQKVIGDGTNGVANGLTRYAYSVSVVDDIDGDGSMDKLAAGSHTLYANILPDALISSSSSSSSSYTVNASVPDITMYTRDTTASIATQADLVDLYENIEGTSSNISDLNMISLSTTNNTLLGFIGIDISSNPLQFISNGHIDITLIKMGDSVDIMGTNCKDIPIFDDGADDGWGVFGCKFPQETSGGLYTYTITFEPDTDSGDPTDVDAFGHERDATGPAGTSDSQVEAGSRPFTEGIWDNQVINLQFTDGDPITDPDSVSAKDFEDLIYTDPDDLSTSKIYTASNAGVGQTNVPGGVASTGQCGSYGSTTLTAGSGNIPASTPTSVLTALNNERQCVSVQGFLYSNGEFNHNGGSDKLTMIATGYESGERIDANFPITGSATKVKENGALDASANTIDATNCTNAQDCYRIPFTFYLPQFREAIGPTEQYGYSMSLKFVPDVSTEISSGDFMNKVSNRVRPKPSTPVNITTHAQSATETSLTCSGSPLTCSAAKNDYYYKSALPFIPVGLAPSGDDRAQFTINQCTGSVVGSECNTVSAKSLVLNPATSTSYSMDSSLGMLASGIHTQNVYSNWTSAQSNTPFGKLSPGKYQFCTAFRAGTGGWRMLASVSPNCFEITVVKAAPSLEAGQDSDEAGPRTTGAHFSQSSYDIPYNDTSYVTINITPEGYNPLLTVSPGAKVNYRVCVGSWAMPSSATTLVDQVAMAKGCTLVGYDVSQAPSKEATFNFLEGAMRTKSLSVSAIYKSGTYKLVATFEGDTNMQDYYAITTLNIAKTSSNTIINNCVPRASNLGETAWTGGVPNLPAGADDTCGGSMLFSATGSGALDSADRDILNTKGMDGSSIYVKSPNRKVYLTAMSSELSEGLNGDNSRSNANLIADWDDGYVNSQPEPEFDDSTAGTMYLNVYSANGSLVRALEHKVTASDILDQHKIMYGAVNGGSPLGSAYYGFTLPDLGAGQYYLMGCFSGDVSLNLDCYSYGGRELSSADFIATTGADAFKLTATATTELFADAGTRSTFRQITVKQAPYGDISGYFAGANSGGVSTQCASSGVPNTLDLTQYFCVEVKTASDPETTYMESNLDNNSPGDATVVFKDAGVQIGSKTCLESAWTRVRANTYQCLIALSAANDETIIKAAGQNATVQIAVDSSSTFVQKSVDEDLTLNKSTPSITTVPYLSNMSAACQARLTADCTNYAVKVKVVSPGGYPTAGAAAGDIKGSGIVRLQMFGPSSAADIASNTGDNDGMGPENTGTILSTFEQAGVTLDSNGEAIFHVLTPPIGYGEGIYHFRAVYYSGDDTFDTVTASGADTQNGGITNADGTSGDALVTVAPAVTHVLASARGAVSNSTSITAGESVEVSAAAFIGDSAAGSVCSNLITSDLAPTGRPLNEDATFEIAVDSETNVVDSGDLSDIVRANTCAGGYINISSLIDGVNFTSAGSHTIYVKFMGNDWFEASTASVVISTAKTSALSLETVAVTDGGDITTARLDRPYGVILTVPEGIDPSDGDIDLRFVKVGGNWDNDLGVEYRESIAIDSSMYAGTDIMRGVNTDVYMVICSGLSRYITEPGNFFIMARYAGNDNLNAFEYTSASISESQFTVNKAEFNIIPSALSDVPMTNKGNDYVDVSIDIPDYTNPGTAINTAASPTQITAGKLSWYIAKDNSAEKVYEGEISVTDTDCQGVEDGTNTVGCYSSPTTALDPTTAGYKIPLQTYDRPGTYELYITFSGDPSFLDSTAITVLQVVVTQGDDVVKVVYEPGDCGTFPQGVEGDQYYPLNDTLANGGTTVIHESRVPQIIADSGCIFTGWTTEEVPDWTDPNTSYFDFETVVPNANFTVNGDGNLVFYAQYLYSFAPQISVSKTRFKHEEEFEVRGYNFAPNQDVQVNLHSSPYALGQARTDVTGSFIVAASIEPKEVSSVDVGEHTVAVQDVRANPAADVSIREENGTKVMLYGVCEWNSSIDSDNPRCQRPSDPGTAIPGTPGRPPGTCTVAAIDEQDCIEKGGEWVVSKPGDNMIWDGEKWVTAATGVDTTALLLLLMLMLCTGGVWRKSRKV